MSTTEPSRDVLRFTLVALPVGWLALSVPLITGLPTEPFVIVTLALGMVLPALLLSRRRRLVTPLLRDAVRLPRPRITLLGLALLPAMTWLVAAAGGSATAVGPGSLADIAVQFVSALLLINLAEEVVWTGFVQRRLGARFGFVGGALLTAALFVGIHLPLAFVGWREGPARVALDIAAMVVAGVGLRLLIGAADRLGGSLLLAAALHASFNTAAAFVEPRLDVVRYAVALGLGLGAAALVWARRRPTRVVRDFVRIVRSGEQPDRAAEFLAPVVEAHQVRGDAPSVLRRTPEEYADHVREFRRMFGTFSIDIDELLGDGSRVYVRWIQHGQHVGEIDGHPPTGGPLTAVESAVYEVHDGRIRRYWIQADIAGVRAQLAALTDPEPTTTERTPS